MATLLVCLFLLKSIHAELIVEAPANPEREWTQKSTGKTVKGILLGLASSDEAAFIIEKKEIRIPLNVLEQDDLERIREIILPTGIDTSAILRTQLTDNKNRRIEATLLSTDGRSLKFVTEKGEKIFPIHLLSEDSRNFIGKWNPKPTETPDRFVNILGMEFVPVEGTDVWFCTHETRVQDYFTYLKMSLGKSDSGLDQGWRGAVVRGTMWASVSGSLSAEDPSVIEKLASALGKADSPERPVVFVSWDDAQAFCKWLSENSGLEYRLPSDHEWSLAVGIGNREDPNASPKDKNGLIGEHYPWGTGFPPPMEAGNYRDFALRVFEEYVEDERVARIEEELRELPVLEQYIRLTESQKKEFLKNLDGGDGFLVDDRALFLQKIEHLELGGGIDVTRGRLRELVVRREVLSIPSYMDYYYKAAPVKNFKANALGLYDLGGNVAEWCDDLFDRAETPESGARVIRGGGWDGGWQADGADLLSSTRTPVKRDGRYESVGFRIVVEMPRAGE